MLLFQKIDPHSEDWQEPVPPGECPVDAVMTGWPDVVGSCGVWEGLFSGLLAMKSGLTAYHSAAAVEASVMAANADPGAYNPGWEAAFLADLKRRVAELTAGGRA